MIVVSDTTPLISLMKAGRLELLEPLFKEVLIPEAVFAELTTNARHQREAEQIGMSSFIRVVTVSEQKAVDILQRASGLDLGESEAIVFADDVKADVLLMDEAKGRQVAKAMGLQIMGTVGVLLFAYQEKLISGSDVEAALNKMKNESIYIGEDLFNYAMSKIEV